MKKALVPVLVANLFLPIVAQAASPIASITKEWTYAHSNTGVAGQVSEISAYDSITNTVWVAGVKGVDVLNATNGSLVQHISTTSFGNINSVAIKNGIAAFALEDAANRSNAGVVKLFDTSTRSLLAGVNSITVGSLPDMLTFTADGSKLLVANEATPNFISGSGGVNHYGTRIGTTTPRVYGSSANDPVGSVSVIDMTSRTVVATPTFNGVTTSGTNIRTNTGMDFEPEYITVDAHTNKAFVTLQEANAVAILDLNTNTFEKVVGLGAKDFSLPGNTFDPNNNGSVSFINANVKGLYMPDAIASYRANGNTYMVMANEGDFREDDADRSAASSLIGTGNTLSNLRISNTDSTSTDLYMTGARSFSIRDANGALIYDSGDILDKEAFARGIYDDGRSRDKGVEPEGVELFTLNGRTVAAVGLERTTKAAVALFDITDPNAVSFLDMIVTDGDVSPEGLDAFEYAGKSYLTISNEVSNTTTLYSIAAVPEPEQYAFLLAGLACLFVQRKKFQGTK
jgi:DNA-binding beta-propeller fold protein YncE